MSEDLSIPAFLRRPVENTSPDVPDNPRIESIDIGKTPGHSFITYEAIKIAYKQQIEGNVVTFRLNFDQDVQDLANLPLGSRVILAVAEIKE